jgi:hypothetical protein
MPTKSRAIQTVQAEIVPLADQEVPRNPVELLQSLVAHEVAALLKSREDFLFQPFLNSKRVSYEIRRLQTVPERNAWIHVFAEHGCLSCERKDVVYGSCGFCARCHARILKWKQIATRRDLENSPQESRPCDLEAVAREALRTPRPALPPATDDCKPKRRSK